MDTDQARAILRANEAKERALANLGNAASMSTDDPRAEEMLESAGDAYASAVAALRNVDLEAVPLLMPDGTLVTHGRGELGPGQDKPGDPEGPLSSPAAAASARETPPEVSKEGPTGQETDPPPVAA